MNQKYLLYMYLLKARTFIALLIDPTDKPKTF